MHPVKVLVANQPRLIRELVVAAISDQAGLEIVGEIQNESEIAAAVDRNLPDFLIVSLGQQEERPDICDVLLQRYPKMTILALAPERNTCMSYRAVFDIRTTRVELSQKGILDALRNKIDDPGHDAKKLHSSSVRTEKDRRSDYRKFSI